MSIISRLMGKAAPKSAADRLELAQAKAQQLRDQLAQVEASIPALEATAQEAALNEAIDGGKAATEASRKADEALSESRRRIAGITAALAAFDREADALRVMVDKEDREAKRQGQIAEAKAGLAALPDLEKRARKLQTDFTSFKEDARGTHGEIAGAVLAAMRSGEVFSIPSDVVDELQRASEGDFRSADQARRDREREERWRRDDERRDALKRPAVIVHSTPVVIVHDKEEGEAA